MISRRSKWFIGGFAIGLAALTVTQILSFKLLHEIQVATVGGTQTPSPEELYSKVQGNTILKVGPYLLIAFYVGCLSAVLALISLILDNRVKR